jgi:hypothetical protein
VLLRGRARSSVCCGTAYSGRSEEDRGEHRETAGPVEQATDIGALAGQKNGPDDRENIGTKNSSKMELGPWDALFRVKFCRRAGPGAMPCPLGQLLWECRCPCVFNNNGRGAALFVEVNAVGLWIGHGRSVARPSPRGSAAAAARLRLNQHLIRIALEARTP